MHERHIIGSRAPAVAVHFVKLQGSVLYTNGS
ncbi:hypothetical protein SHXM_04704 [Streptomyces hygroscopicus]|nr:hypothetical protein SHXM_04704 [Streptomyces hygroscopicus]